MDIDTIQIRITHHAHQRYCQRVGQIEKRDLVTLVRCHLARGYRMTKGYLYAGDLWWRATRKDNVLTLHTCYGETHIDIPDAVRWAKRYKDRIALG